jgi:septal ring factor EnvC (AmiA/AmiB activator)
MRWIQAKILARDVEVAQKQRLATCPRLLARQENGAPRTGLRRSRYGRAISPRLDEEIEELKRRLDELERQRGI